MDSKTIRLVDLTAANAIEFCNNEYDFEGLEEVIYDHKFLGTVEPFAMLLAGSKIRELYDKFPDVTYRDINFKHNDYAAHMGFFQSVYQDFGNKPGEANGSSTYVPITELDVKKLKIESYENSEVVQETIERKAINLARVLSRDNRKLRNILSYSIRELMRNIVEHSESESIWFAGQFWPSKDRVEIAILDEGVGIKQALSFNPNLKIRSDIDALLLSIEPGISGKAFKYKGKMRRQEDTIWQNSGYGLYVTSEICQLGGDFLICSGNNAVIVKNNIYADKETNFKGTGIRMRLKVSRINSINEDIIDKIVKKGEQKAKENSELSIISASKVSRMLTVTQGSESK
ncbi:sensor histidine kinase [Neobacillus novalis]|uniref:Sensor histidine kinase n=1 Tax=Neobacillus novalis TaxID=220687 RepID=A0AA95MQ75_9BACI|nr:sensor histidine kinase [Neobacillus novalis]WHY87575.1 sensor histidine kinase [Neobacillus novalis]